MKMKKLTALVGIVLLCSCTHLTKQEQDELHQLKAQGITVEKSGDFEAPTSAGAAGALNLLPGFGNFYLANGRGADSSHWLYGFLNLLTWPISIIWGVPEAVVDANRINERELIYYYKYDKPKQKEFNIGK